MRTPFAVIGLLSLFAVAATAQEPVVTSGNTSYTLRPGDVIRINVWGQPDFSGQFQVNEEGKILYPLVGEIQIEGRTVGELRQTIRDDLAGIFNQPFVSITPLFRVAVIGEVRAPGLLNVDPTLSVLDIVALAGGTNQNANINKIRLMRQGKELELGLDSDQFGQTLQQIGIQSGDQIYVPKKAITTTEWLLLIQMAQLALSVAIFINTVN